VKKPLLVLFDGNALIHRAFHALPPLSLRKTGELVGAVFGFAQILLKVLNELQPTHYAIAFDKAALTFRHVMYEQYKATRKETPSELVGQFSRVRELVKAFKIPIYELEGYEADDVLGTLGKQASEQGMDTVIVTGDADTMQLVTDQVKVLYPRPRGNFSDADLFDTEAVIAKYNIGPDHIVDYKALKGDPSDNIPGVPGIGEKTAVKLIQQFGGVEHIYEHLDEVTPPRVQTLLREHKTEADQSKKLATIVMDTPVKLDLKECEAANYDREKVVELLRELEFSSLLPRLPQPAATQTVMDLQVVNKPALKREYYLINTLDELNRLAKRLSVADSFAIDTQTDSLNPVSGNLVGISISASEGEAYYIPLGHTGLSTIPQLSLDIVKQMLGPVFEDPAKPKITHNGKLDMMALADNGIRLANLEFDCLVAAYLLCEQSSGLNALAFKWLGVEMNPISELTGTGVKQIALSKIDVEKYKDYACADVDITFQLSKLLRQELKTQKLWDLFNEIEMPLVPVLLHMEQSGVLLDVNLLERMSGDLEEQLKMLEASIYQTSGEKFNINSTQQLGAVLADKMGLSAVRKRGGGYSTSAEILESIKDASPIISYILDYRQVSKLKSTYVDALPTLVNPLSGRVHTSFNQTRTTTGRLSSSDPNLQNIPIRTTQGKEIRQAFIAPEGSFLFAADYSQIDLRSLAHLSQDTNLVNAFLNDEDIHTATAAQLFGVSISQVLPEMRRLAKTVNFGVIYGMSEFGLQQAAELSRDEASKFISAYFEKYPGVKWYLELTKQQARNEGYVLTMLGRKRIISEIKSPNRQVREAAERMAINMPVQGTSADIIKKAMVDIYAEMQKRRLKSKILLQVHDELIFEVPENELTAMRVLVSDLMVNTIKLIIPLKVECKVGRNWGEMEE
jgi:DNA polymerase-1